VEDGIRIGMRWGLDLRIVVAMSSGSSSSGSFYHGLVSLIHLVYMYSMVGDGGGRSIYGKLKVQKTCVLSWAIDRF